MIKKKVIFWGPLGDSMHFGGGGSGNNRTIMEKLGHSIAARSDSKSGRG